MAQCYNCAAPLPANANLCIYCGSRNDVDLKGKHSYSISQKESGRLCPHCDRHLQTISLNSNDPIYIERCDLCYGLFFDPGEIEAMLSEYSADVFDINYKHIRNINQDRYRAGNKVQYIKCPVCGILMNRINFGYRSGVIVDSCKSHGVWLDNGEITHLLEWRKAGGQLLHEINVQRSLARRENFLKINRSGGTTVENLNRCSFSNSIMYEDLLNSLSSVIFKLFE